MNFLAEVHLCSALVVDEYKALWINDVNIFGEINRNILMDVIKRILRRYWGMMPWIKWDETHHDESRKRNKKDTPLSQVCQLDKYNSPSDIVEMAFTLFII